MAESIAPRVPAEASRAAVARLVATGAAVGLTACLAVGGLAFADGGYFPVSWGWSALPLLAVVAAALAIGVAVELSVLDGLFLGALAGLAGWTALSLLWTGSVPRTVLECERVLVYLGAAVAGVLLVRRSAVTSLVVALWAALVVVVTYGLLTRLFPEQLGSFDPVSEYRLSSPVGYWNALGILAVIGALLALGLASRSVPLLGCLAGGTTVLFLLALYFTYSRASWIALFAGLAVACAVDRRPLQLITTAIVLAPWSILAIVVASTSPALTHETAALEAASTDGHGLAVIAIGLVVAAALSILAADWVRETTSIPTRLRRVYAGTLLFIAAAVLIVIFGRYGFPHTLVRKTYHAFNSVPPTDQGDLNSRLFSLSGNGRTEYWHTAWQQATTHPVLGGGAGTYDEFWFQHTRIGGTVHDAHNLYLETLAELGPVGLLLLVLALVVPLVAARRARWSPLAAVVLGAYVAFLLHAAADWDWEMPAVMLTGLFCGIALLAAGRREGTPRSLRGGVRVSGAVAVLALFGFGLLGLLGNSAVSASSKSADAGNYARAAEQARRAMDYAPWSSAPWRRLGEAQALAGNLAGARASFRRAIAKDRADWTLWFDLADASQGAARARALAVASRLNPHDERLRPASG